MKDTIEVGLVNLIRSPGDKFSDDIGFSNGSEIRDTFEGNTNVIIDEKYGSLLINVLGEVINEGLITLSLEEVLIGFTQNINYNPDNSIVLQKPRITVDNDILEWIIVKLLLISYSFFIDIIITLVLLWIPSS